MRGPASIAASALRPWVEVECEPLARSPARAMMRGHRWACNHAAPMKKTERRVSPWRDLASLLWKVPLFALPVGLFIQVTSGAAFSRFWEYYTVSMVFAVFTLFGVWTAQHWLVPAFPARRPRDQRLLTLKITAIHTGMAMLFGVSAALTLHFTLVPGLLGTGRAILTMLMYFVVLGVVFVGVTLANHFYREAMERAGSERELLLARRIQQSFLPSEFPRHPRLEVHATNLASKEVSGDFYDVVPIGDGGYLLAIADVSGKGVPAALLSSMLQASLRTQASPEVRVGTVMASMNALVCRRPETGQFATFFLAAVNGRDLALRFTNAGHNFPMLFRSGRTPRTLETGGLVVGMMEGLPYEEETVPLEPGDRVVFYTDGLTEAARADGLMFGEERLAALFGGFPAGLSARELVERTLAGLREFMDGAEAADDVTVMVLRVLNGAP